MIKPQSEYYKSLPAKRMGAGVLFFNKQNEFLIVQPTYKESWEIPGGAVELNESPQDAALREVYEELGLKINPDTLRLRCVEYMSSNEEKTEALMFIFSGGLINDSQIELIKLPESELKNYKFVNLSQGLELLGSNVGNRVKKCLESSSCIYTEGKY